MSKGNPLKIWKTVGLGFKIPHLNPSVFIPAALSSAVSSAFMFFTVAFYQPGEEPELIQTFTGILSTGEFTIFALLNLLITVFAGVVITKMAYDSSVGKPDMTEAISFSAKKFIPILATSILYGLIVSLGTVLLILPGIFLSIKLMLFMYFILFENKGILNSLSASWQLLKGNWWRVFALSFIWGTIMFVPATFIVYLGRTTETIVYFVLYLLWQAWLYSSFVAAYQHLRSNVSEAATVV
ncbi:MAG: hypothetical protein DDT40_01975 [candidate division WS2 bacterium]|nr:hypothetical protein [Candidatus Psychracetigena formicireducens]